MSLDAVGELAERFRTFLTRYYRDEVGRLAQAFPDRTSLVVSYDDLYRFDADLALDWLAEPEHLRAHAERGLAEVDLPVRNDLDGATIRLVDLPNADTYYPGSFFPRETAGRQVAIQGQVARATEVYAKVIEACFECQRCGCFTNIPQTGSGFQEPHECEGCERQGPFRVELDHSTFVDAQKLRVEEPPERTADGNASFIDVYLDGHDVVDVVDPGDRVCVTGVLHLEQQTAGTQKTGRFEPYLEGRAVTPLESEFDDLALDEADRAAVERLAAETDDIYEAAVASIAPGIQGEEYRPIKLAMFLQLIGGTRAYADGTGDRGDFHTLVIGDPSTGKSALQEWFEEIAPRAVTVSGEGASVAGVTAAAVRDDFSDNGEWTLEAGALVQANGGHVCVDELDKMDPDVVNSMHRAMEQQKIPISKAGINATLPARTAIFAAANPKHGRWDRFQSVAEQIELSPTLLSRFSLIWRLSDRPDVDRDSDLADAILRRKEALKKAGRTDWTLADDERASVDPEIPADLLRKYVAYARREVAAPVFADESVRESLVEAFVGLRAANDADEDAAVPVTRRKVPDFHRLAEAAARAELSDEITDRHVEIAERLVRTSLRQFGVNEEGDLDADIVETGTSKPQAERKTLIEGTLRELAEEYGSDPVPYADLAEAVEMDCERVKAEVQEWKDRGWVYEPTAGETIRWVGKR